MTNNELNQRIDNLESQLAFQEDTIDALNQLVTAQSSALATLQDRVTRLAQKLQQVQDFGNEGADPSAHEPPPHY